VNSFEVMTNTDGKKQPGTDQGNETREFRSPEGDSEDELAVTEEETTLAEEHIDGGEPCGRK
jgi:hypothetical protein